MAYQFEELDLWQTALEYLDLVYELAEKVSKSEIFNAKNQLTQAAYRILKNIAASASCEDRAEQIKFLRSAIQAVSETVTCYHVIRLRNYIHNAKHLRVAYDQSLVLSEMLLERINSLTAEESVADSFALITASGSPFSDD